MKRAYLFAAITVILNAIFFATLWLLLQPKTEPVPTAPTVATSTTVAEKPLYQQYSIIGTTVEGRSIESYSFGTGAKHLLFVGGIHGGYEWNTATLAYTAVAHFAERPELIPKDITLTIIPNLNPDGTFAVLGTDGRTAPAIPPTNTSLGRFNGNQVDLNRNFDCKWQAESTWRGQSVSAGTAPFSEPEAQALKDVITATPPVAAIFWHSQGNAVYGSACEAGILPGTTALLATYGTAAGYQTFPIFDAYPITGDAESWLAAIDIPAITVELSSHEVIEWEKNLAGILAVIDAYSEQ